MIQLFFATVRTEPLLRDKTKINALRDEAVKALKLLDEYLEDKLFIAGNTFSMGDIPIGCVVYRYLTVDVDRPDLRHIQEWYERLSERPAYKKHVMRHFGTNPTEWHELEKACVNEGIL